MEAERAARATADGGSRTAFAGGLASTHGLSESEREQRDAAQRKIKKALSTAEGRSKVIADPKKLPTAKVGERWLCQWENVGLPCGQLGNEHFERNAHKVCAYCLVIGHTLVQCPMALKDSVDIAGLNKAVKALSAAGAPASGGAKGGPGGKGGGGKGGGGKGGKGAPPAAALSKWDQMEAERAARSTPTADGGKKGGGKGQSRGGR